MAKVLFVCKQNAGRSQMSEALFRRAVNGRHEARSAGTQPADQVHSTVVELRMGVLPPIVEGIHTQITAEMTEVCEARLTAGRGL